MNNKKQQNNDIILKVQELLPWYVTGQIEKEEKIYVDDALAKYPELQEQLQLEYKIEKNLHQEKELFQLSEIEPAQERLKAVLNNSAFSHNKTQNKVDSIASVAATSATTASSTPSFFQSLFGNARKAQYIGFATAAIVAGVISFNFIAPSVSSTQITSKENATTTFSPAYAGNNIQRSEQRSILLGLKVGLDDARVAIILSKYKFEASPVEGGKKSMYRIKFKKKLSAKEVKVLVGTLLSKDELVWFAGETY